MLSGEDPRAFARLRQALIDRLVPEGPVEDELVERLAALFWRLRRAPAAEAALLAALDEEQAAAGAARQAAGLHDRHGILIGRLQRYETHIERSFLRTLALLAKLREGRTPGFPQRRTISAADARAELARRIALMSERGKAHDDARREES